MVLNVKLKLRQQIILLISLSLLIPAIAITSVSIYKINSKAEEDIGHFRNDEMAKLKQYLKHITDVAYGMVEARHQQLTATTGDTTMTEDKVRTIMTEQCLQELAKIRFDQG